MDTMTTRRISPQWIIGGSLIAIGGVLLLMNVGIIERFPVWKFWPIALIVLGIARMTQPFRRADGFWLFALGAWLQVSFLRLWGMGFGDTWPVLLIALGIFWMWGAVEKQAMRNQNARVMSQSSSQSL